MKPLNDQLLAHHTNTLKLGVGFGNSVNPYIDEMRAIIRKRVAGFDSEKRTKARLQKLIETLANQLDKPAGKWLEQLKSELKSFAKYEADYQAEAIGGFVKVELTAPTVNQVWAAAKFQPLALGTKPVDFEKLIDDWGIDEVSRLVMGVKTGFIQGQTAKQIIKDVVGAGGLSDISQRNAMSLAQTALSHIAATAKQEFYAENDDVVVGYSLINTLDSGTTPQCRAWLPTKVYKLTDSYQPREPFHRGCRTVSVPALAPEFDFLDEGATRAANMADGGQTVDANTGYYNMLLRQPAAYQDEVLGKTKGLIFRNAGLSPEEFRKLSVDNLGRPLTIDQLISADKRISEYMQNKV
jgi:SPP1 gp7 family putative phage head morphogenesis protein